MVLAVFFAYIGGAIYGLTTLQEGLQRRKLSRADSYSIEFYDREDFYFREFPYRMQVTLCEEHSYILCMLYILTVLIVTLPLIPNTLLLLPDWKMTCYCSVVYITLNVSTFNLALTNENLLFMIHRTHIVWLEVKRECLYWVSLSNC